MPDFLPAVDLVTLLALLPPGVPFDDLGVFIFFEELDFDFGRAEGDGDEVREDGDDLLEEDGVEDRSASSTYLEVNVEESSSLMRNVNNNVLLEYHKHLLVKIAVTLVSGWIFFEHFWKLKSLLQAPPALAELSSSCTLNEVINQINKLPSVSLH